MKSKNIYSLPLKEDTIYLAISDPRAHYSYWKYAIDFAIDFNVPILAAFEGKVIDVKDDANEGGDDEKYADNKYNNWITIKHANKELSQYVHLEHKSSLVKVGDKVKKGQPISNGIGMVGYSTTPHLHFMVCVDKDNEVGFESREIRFDKKLYIIKNGKEHTKELIKSKYKKLKELEEKYHTK